MFELKRNYRICRRVYQSLLVNIADLFIQYIHKLDPDEIEQMNNDLKANGWGVKSVVEIQYAFEFLWTFQMFYYYNRWVLSTNAFLIVPDGNTPPGSEKISLKTLYEMFKDTK